MELYSNTATDESGNVVNGASVSVTIASSGAVVTGLKDKDGNALGNPFLTGYDRAKGEIEFQAANGLYNITVTGNPGATKKNQALYDPTDGESPTWAGNGIYNGKMTISQRGDFTSPTAFTSNAYYLDRWKTVISGGSNADIQDLGGSLKVIKTVSPFTGNMGLEQRIENVSYYAGKTVTISAKVTSNTSECRLYVSEGGGGGDTLLASHSGSGNEELLSGTITLGSSLSSLSVFARLLTSGLGNTSIAVGDYVTIDDARLDLGSHRLSGDREHGEELALCQRYYQPLCETPDDTICAATRLGVGDVIFSLPLVVPMAGVPSIISSGDFFLRGDGSTAELFNTPSYRSINNTSVTLRKSGLSSGVSIVESYTVLVSTNAALALSAEL